MRNWLILVMLFALSSPPVLADEPGELSTTNGVLLSIFVGFGTGHFYAKQPGSGAAFLISQAGAVLGEIALVSSVGRKAQDSGFDEADLRRYNAGMLAFGAIGGASRIIEATTVIGAVDRYNNNPGMGTVSVDRGQRGTSTSIYDPGEAQLDDDYRGDSAYTADAAPARPSPEEARSKAAWKLTTLIYIKLDRENDDEREDVYILVSKLMDAGYLPASILAAVETGTAEVVDAGTASACSIIRAGIRSSQ